MARKGRIGNLERLRGGIVTSSLTCKKSSGEKSKAQNKTWSYDFAIGTIPLAPIGKRLLGFSCHLPKRSPMIIAIGTSQAICSISLPSPFAPFIAIYADAKITITPTPLVVIL